MRRIKPEEWPSLVLRGTAIVLIVMHLIAGVFVYSHFVFFLTAAVLALLLSKEMYEEMAMRFFKLKSDTYEREMEEARAHPAGARDVTPPIDAEDVPWIAGSVETAARDTRDVGPPEGGGPDPAPPPGSSGRGEGDPR
ncbi:MAG: Photosystem I protein M (PsaM) [Rhodobacteraceae bacterium HLUCCA09]|nr:MAG: Photosystem I protein M (PsaM) [Rhodobacteraceae bacterium HLUCCA09]